MKKLLGLSILVVFFMVLGFGFQFFQNFVSVPAGPGETEVVYEVLPGKTFQRVARDLQDKGLIKNAFLFSWYARIRGGAGKMKVGEYGLRPNMTLAEVLAVITSGKSIGRLFTVSEGLNIFEISDLYEKQGYGPRQEFLDLCYDQEFIQSLIGEAHYNLEGYLFPETYQITKYMKAKDLITTMVKKFQEVYREVMPADIPAGWTQHQIVTLASIVEKETGSPEERPDISSVFHNRLARGMLLQTDPTILYGMADEQKQVVMSIRKADILRRTKYNTYVIKGLPPGPIANPGRAALLAAVEPAQTNYLFFVSRNDGTHIFSENYQAHQNAVRRFQQDPRARRGKSWRDLEKKRKNK